MRRIDNLNGLKSWWNRNAKPQFKTSLSAEQFKLVCFSEYANTGSVEMRSYQSKDNRTHNFDGEGYYS